MKKIVRLLLFTALIGIMGQCKKGEEDPFISLRSRKARVAGDWKLTSGTATSSYASTNSSSSSNTTYSESSYTRVSSYSFGGTTSSSTTSELYSLKMTFEKDGKFEMTETEGVDFYTITGTWNFTGKIGDHKNKEQIVITILTSLSSGGGSLGTYSGNSTDLTFNIKELRNKKMVLVTESSSVSGSSTSNDASEIVLEQ